MNEKEILRQATKYEPIVTFMTKEGLTGIYRIDNNIVRTFLVKDVDNARREIIRKTIQVESENE